MAAKLPPFIREQQRRAAALNAPIDAIFEGCGADGKPNGTWSTVSELKSNHFFHERYQKALQLAKEIA